MPVKKIATPLKVWIVGCYEIMYKHVDLYTH